jgi:hypothetical protein
VPFCLARRGDRDRRWALCIEAGESAERFLQRHCGRGEAVQAAGGRTAAAHRICGPGRFLGLAVPSTYAFSTEAIEPVWFCRFSLSMLRSLLVDLPDPE